jgi:hypothetical protein
MPTPGSGTPASPAPTPPAPIALVVHGHFYQPPRENPWTDEISREPSAAPFHDWNERILAECYRANGFARLYGGGDRLRALVNNYAYLSFNVGPTLARFIERVDATTQAQMRAGDQDQTRRLGAGGALAQVWAHPIAPLLTPRDRRTQIAWGLADFERRFGRKAEGMWLPETAADPATLESLIEAGLSYTILAPEQIAAVRPPGGAWRPVDRDSLDTGRAYRFTHGDGSGRTLALAVFDGPLSRELAFGTATRDSESFLAAMRNTAARSSATGHRLVLAASDGELYGHHKKFADLTLAHAVAEAAPRAGIAVTNLAAFLRQEPPTWDAELAKGPLGEGTAWSCAHGLGRWQRHCGCAMRSPEESGWTQAWRTPLRAALDRLREGATAFYADVAGDLFTDPDAVRDDFGAVIEAPPDERQRFLARRGRRGLRRGQAGGAPRGLLLMELERACQSMYASCGWFFDDVAGIESALVIRQAAYAMDLWKEIGGRPPLREVVDRLGEARSNIPYAGTGADVFRRVSQHRTTAAHAVAALALSDLAGAAVAATAHATVSGFTVDRARGKAEAHPTIKGKATARHQRTGEPVELRYEARAKTALQLSCKVGNTEVALPALPEESREPIALALLARLAVAPRVTARDGRQALELARSVGSAGDRIDPAFHQAFASLLPRLLEAQPADEADAESLAVITELFEAVPAPARGEAAKRVQEWVWQGLQHARTRGRPPALGLRTLAQLAGFTDA